MHKIIEDLNWRYATKKFDNSRIIDDSDFEIIKESLRLAASSYGLQPLHYIIVESKEIREKLKQAAYNQSQITDASHMIIICAYTDLGEHHIDKHIKNVSTTREIHLDEIKGYGDYMKKTISTLNSEEITNWNIKQAYIALGQLLHTCASLRIDSTPMEGFEIDKYNSILGLEEKPLTAVLACPIGYRDANDKSQFENKVRKNSDDIFETI